MAGFAEVEIRVPQFDYADRIPEIHIKVIDILMLLIEQQMVLTHSPNLLLAKIISNYRMLK